jgi:hypothetical protein
MRPENLWSRYGENHRRRYVSTMTNPLAIGAITVFVWIFFRWWPAIVMTSWLAICVALSFREKRKAIVN